MCVCELMLLRVGFSGLAHISVCVCVSKRVFVCVCMFDACVCNDVLRVTVAW